ncbi:fimbrial protein [Shewanella cutis]|uniref:Type 1 fimbrial protein n=1 Tax=Shewanella cutis TaxID=2766780 RepID=A0ABS9R108_9GAMM|nr:fimbrial protein [Shewanella sp. PS-2]MCG9966234.1 type 1 fimbrial protein [Shewanella sp. PS-2]
MKKLTLTLAITAIFAINAQASNIITFKGEVATQTCIVDVNGSNSQPLVLLPTIAASDLPDVGATAGGTAFKISVTGCIVDTVKDQPIKTVFVANQLTAGGNLKNTGTATNVALQILTGPGGTKVDLTGSVGTAGLVVKKNENAASHEFVVQYVRDGVGMIDPGSVVSTVQYAISYL